MASCKYYKQVRQVSYDSGVTWISLDEYQKGDLYETDSPDCGGGITQYKWVNVSGEYTCVGTTKYQKTKKQQSTDGGQTWTDVNPPEYSTGAVIERDSPDCGGSCLPFLEYCCGRGSHSDCDIQLESASGSRVYDTMYICGESDIGYEVYVTNTLPSWLKVRVYREDVGFETLEENIGATRYFTVELESNHSRWQQQCTEGSLNSYCTTASVVVKQLGCIPNLKFKATYNNAQSYSLECNSSAVLSQSDTKPSGYDYTKMTSAIIGNCVTSIGDYALGGFSGLTSVTIPDSVTSIGFMSLCGCYGLTSITIPSGVTSIGDTALSNCSGLTSVTFARNSQLRIISANCFVDCDNLRSITIPNGVTTIGINAFWGCDKLTDVNIPNTVTTIGADAFGYCRVLSGVTIPSGVTVIGDYTFQRCNALKTITFPSGTTSIGHGALYYCTSLNRITCLATTPPTLDETAFYNTNNAPIYVPSQSVNAYKSASGWSNYSSRIRAIS